MQLETFTYFEIEQINHLRERAENKVKVSERGPPGWSKSVIDPNKLLNVFSMLDLKDGYILRAYQYRSGSNGNGVVWAMPENAPFLEPGEYLDTKDSLHHPPQPPSALSKIMNAIGGDGSPWSYFCASIFAREVEEFGAIWHGCYWSTFTIISVPPWENNTTLRDKSAIDVGKQSDWVWFIDPPTSMLPRVAQTKDIVIVSFYTYSGLSHEAIYLNIDTYRRGNYEFDREIVSIAEGKGGYIF